MQGRLRRDRPQRGDLLQGTPRDQVPIHPSSPTRRSSTSQAPISVGLPVLTHSSDSKAFCNPFSAAPTRSAPATQTQGPLFPRRARQKPFAAAMHCSKGDITGTKSASRSPPPREKDNTDCTGGIRLHPSNTSFDPFLAIRPLVTADLGCPGALSPWTDHTRLPRRR